MPLALPPKLLTATAPPRTLVLRGKKAAILPQRKEEALEVIVCETPEEMSRKAAELFAERIKARPDIALGLATGGTPEGMYRELAGMNRAGDVDFSKVRSFNLDEYLGLEPTHEQSYRCFMNERLFDLVNIDKANTRVPGGAAADPEAECARYEEELRAAGGVDLQLLGIGSNGHVAFNEPGSPADGRTSVVDLTGSTIKDNARYFQSIDEVPKRALSMGIGTILEAKEIVLIAGGAGKAKALARALEGPESEDCPASFLQSHPNVTAIIDKEAASGLKNR